MESKKPRVPRELLVAGAEIVDQQTSQTILGQTLDVSMGGCFVETAQVLPLRSIVQLSINYNEDSLNVFGEVMRSEPGNGMAIRFRALDANQTSMLKAWFFSLERQGW
ncbi:MAG TPA: PilZ domain-containing protein [Candidatus Acidoferrales bacterium]|jgi:hypothetical protein|nr:PilZ domain-containing protein [Candidatus Acidoferrales bacterium]